jgi:hypothetical protein
MSVMIRPLRGEIEKLGLTPGLGLDRDCRGKSKGLGVEIQLQHRDLIRSVSLVGKGFPDNLNGGGRKPGGDVALLPEMATACRLGLAWFRAACRFIAVEPNF